MQNKRILGIDFGLKRIGLALSDQGQILASPLETIHVKTSMDEAIIQIIEKVSPYSLEEIVVGLPIQLNGVKGKSVELVTDFIERLKKKTSHPIQTWDERLSTMQADRYLKEGQLNRKKRSEKVDLVSAIIILQNYLDYKKLALPV